MTIQKTNAIILKTQPFRSSSLIATFFTESFGKVKGLAKGVRQEREIRGTAFDLFTMVEMIYYEKTRSDLHLISDCVIVEAYPLLKAHLEGIAYASYFCELVEQLTEVHDPNPVIFRLLDFSFRYLSAIPGLRIARLFEIKLLHEIGWLPHVDSCLGCEKTEVEEGFFSARQGALYCPRCYRNIPDVKPISRETLSVMRYYIHHDLDACLKLGITRQGGNGLENLMGRFFQDRLNAPLKTLQFLSKIKPVLQ
jgi:DNA repair protein RecO (recombination protein O)